MTLSGPLVFIMLLVGASSVQAQRTCDEAGPVRKLSSFMADVRLCGETAYCAEDGADPFWGQHWIDGDLMLEEMAETRGSSRAPISMAVVDTGIDRKTVSEVFPNPNQVEYGREIEPMRTSSNRDLNGHGTSISSLLVGPNGFALSPDAKVTAYNQSPLAAGRSIEEAKANAKSLYEGRLHSTIPSVIQACDDGHEVIVLSSGDREDEMGQDPIENREKAIWDELGKKGCLVVKAAGNLGNKQVYPTFQEDGPLLRVEARNPQGALAEFSSRGTLGAPGEAILMVNTRSASASNYCGFKFGKVQSGTSFAGPMAAAVAHNVLATLKQSPYYSSLKKENQVKLVRRILSASEMAGTVNGLRAVYLAKQFAKRKDWQIPSSSELVQLLEVSGRDSCETAREMNSCLKTSDCAKQAKCHKEKRKALALCLNPSSQTLEQALNYAVKSGNFDEAKKYLKMMSTEKPERLTEIARNLQDALIAVGEAGGFSTNPLGAEYFIRTNKSMFIRMGDPAKDKKMEHLLKEAFQTTFPNMAKRNDVSGQFLRAMVWNQFHDQKQLSAYLERTDLQKQQKIDLLIMIERYGQLVDTASVNRFLDRVINEARTATKDTPGQPKTSKDALNLVNKQLAETDKVGDNLLSLVDTIRLGEIAQSLKAKTQKSRE